MLQDFRLPWAATSGTPPSLAPSALLASLAVNIRYVISYQASIFRVNIQVNQDITACVASDPGACGIQYELKALQVLTSNFFFTPIFPLAKDFGLWCISDGDSLMHLRIQISLYFMTEI